MYCAIHKTLLFAALSIVTGITVASNTLPVERTLTIGIIGISKWGEANNNPITGIMREQSHAIFRMANIQTRHSYALYPRLVRQLKQGFIDCAILTKPPGEIQHNLMISHLYDVEIIALGRKGTVINHYDDFRNPEIITRVGFPNGGKYLFTKLFSDTKVKKQIVPSQQQGPLMLAKGRIDAFIGMKYSLLYGINRDKLLGKTNYPGYPIQRLEVWLQCSKKSALAIHFQARLKSAVKSVKSLRAFQTINDKWMSFLFINH